MILEMTFLEATFMHAIIQAGQFTPVGNIGHNVKIASLVGILKGKFQLNVYQVNLTDEEAVFLKDLLEHAIAPMSRSDLELFRIAAKAVKTVYKRLT